MSSPGLDPIGQIRERLSGRTDVRIVGSDRFIQATPVAANGFGVSLTQLAVGYIVGYDGWHEHFDLGEDALNCFGFGLSDKCRLKVVQAGGYAYKWTVESFEDDHWVTGSTTGLLFFPFWRHRQTTCLSNRLTAMDPMGQWRCL